MPKVMVFVESNTTGTGMLALQRTWSLGYRPVLFTARPQLYPGLPEAAPEVVCCDTNDPAAVRAELERRFPRAMLAGVTTTSEYYVQTVATVATALGLPANPPEAVGICRDKSATRRALHAAGVTQPRFALAGTPEAAAQAARAIGLPCVVKPVADSGSLGVKLCRTAHAVRMHAGQLLGATTNVRGQPAGDAVLVESTLSGPELSVEMFSAGGKAVCIGISEKVLTGAPYFVEDRHIFPAMLPTTTMHTVVQTVKAALAAAGILHGPTHTEVRLTAVGPAVVEINARMAGGMIPELIRLSTGRDLVVEQLRVAAGQPLRRPDPPRRYAGVQMLTAQRPGVLRAVDGVEDARSLPGVHEVHTSAQPGRQVRPARSSFDRLGYVIATGDSGSEVAARLREAAKAIRFQVDPLSGDDSAPEARR